MSQTITNPEQAISVLIQAAKIGQAKGAYSLEDAAMIAKAIQSLVPAQPEAEATAEAPTKKSKKATPTKES
jgi:hypothetical protein